jgi:hypothetical protein
MVYSPRSSGNVQREMVELYNYNHELTMKSKKVPRNVPNFQRNPFSTIPGMALGLLAQYKVPFLGADAA